MDGAEAVEYILNNNIDGAIVECGVDTASFELVCIESLMKNNTTRDIYMYDTFAGFTQNSSIHSSDQYQYLTQEISQQEISVEELGDNVTPWNPTPVENIQEKLNLTGYSQDKLHYVVGDVMQTLTDNANIPDKIAILRLDTSWYESSKFELEKMYDKVVPNGVIIFGEYYYGRGQQFAIHEFFKSINVNYEVVNTNSSKTAAIIKKTLTQAT